MSQELLKAWVHNVLQNPIDDHQLAHANATKDLLEENAQLKEEKKQWEPQWFSEAEANAAGYNEALDEIKTLRAENARYREALDKAEKALKFYRREFD
jgi:predicted nuclease with TOPRIM domain